MQTLLHTDPDAVQAALARLGLEEEILLTAARASYLAKSNATANHPPMHAPFVAWSEAVRALRDGLVTRGWHRNNDKNWPRTIHPNGTVALTVATGNEATGRSGDSPSTKASKGPSTVGALEVNRGLQFWLPGMEPPKTLEADDAEDPKTVTWLLLVHHATNEIRAELSLPLDVDAEGKVAVWRERIILRAIPLDGEPVEVLSPALPDIDVAVRRKA